MPEFWAWYRHARSFGKSVSASLVYARAQSHKEGPVSLGTSRAQDPRGSSDHDCTF